MRVEAFAGGWEHDLLCILGKYREQFGEWIQEDGEGEHVT